VVGEDVAERLAQRPVGREPLVDEAQRVAVDVALESADESSLLFEQAARPSPTTTIRAAMWRRRFRGDGKVVPPDVTRTCAGR